MRKQASKRGKERKRSSLTRLLGTHKRRLNEADWIQLISAMKFQLIYFLFASSLLEERRGEILFGGFSSVDSLQWILFGRFSFPDSSVQICWPRTFRWRHSVSNSESLAKGELFSVLDYSLDTSV